MWLLTPEDIIEASRTKANMPEDWARLQLQKVARLNQDVCEHDDALLKGECRACRIGLLLETGSW